eukprot:SAG11_NODE_704_length_7657_cov_38.765943_5_plen_144_part_00
MYFLSRYVTRPEPIHIYPYYTVTEVVTRFVVSGLLDLDILITNHFYKIQNSTLMLLRLLLVTATHTIFVYRGIHQRLHYEDMFFNTCSRCYRPLGQKGDQLILPSVCIPDTCTFVPQYRGTAAVLFGTRILRGSCGTAGTGYL